MVHFTLIEKGGREYTFLLPECMNEMTVKQLVFLSCQVEEGLPIQVIKTNMLLFCMGARVTSAPSLMREDGLYGIRARRHTFRLSAGMLLEGTKVFDYLFVEGRDGKCYLDTRLTVCPFRRIRLGRRWFYAPDSALYGISYERYVFLESYFDRLQRDEEMMYAFLGVLLRPREEWFDKERLHVRAMRRVGARRSVLLMWYFVGSMRFIAEKFPRIFGGGGSGKGTVGSLYDGQQRLLDFIAKADPERKMRMKHTELYEVLYSLDYIMEENERKQKELERLKHKRV